MPPAEPSARKIRIEDGRGLPAVVEFMNCVSNAYPKIGSESINDLGAFAMLPEAYALRRNRRWWLGMPVKASAHNPPENPHGGHSPTYQN